MIALRAYLPYTMASTQDNGVYDLILNRDYKPIGLVANFSPSVDYSKYDLFKVDTESQAYKDLMDLVEYRNSDNDPYFYSDLTAPWIGKKEMLSLYERFKPFLLKYRILSEY
jgi:hypothetical protein